MGPSLGCLGSGTLSRLNHRTRSAFLEVAVRQAELVELLGAVAGVVEGGSVCCYVRIVQRGAPAGGRLSMGIRCY
jgi:hypothetical protein